MGLLDDAIREHLELKRRRGADAGEITRQEQEAFGPPRRGELELEPAAQHAATDHATFEPAQPAAPSLHAVEDPGAHDEPLAHAHEAPHVQDEPPRPHGDPADSLLEHPETSQPTAPFSAEEVRDATMPPAQPATDFSAERPRAVPDEPPRPPAEPVEPDPPAAEPSAATPPPPAPAQEPPARPEPVAEDDAEDGEEPDVLEETPEFLQETPEHDRLWFEQRPPRDFDF